jgi:diguanylate cyclase
MLDMPPATLRKILEQLDRAMHDHAEWHADLLRAVVCDMPCDPNDLDAGAHFHCRFGHWYYEQSPAELREDPTFAAIGIEHRLIHRIAARILREVAANRPVDRDDFDDLVSGSNRLRGELELLKRDVQGALRSRDEGTGAIDRSQVLPELRRRRSLVKQRSSPCSLLFVDIDRLRDINEAHGYATGDAILATIVGYIQEHLRPDDKVFRYGGDEFLLSLPGADMAVAHGIVTRVREGLSRRPLLVSPGDLELEVTLSFGLTMLDPDVRVEDSIDRAAQALLLAQTAGGNRAVVWDASITTSRDLRRLEVDEKEP